MSGGDIASTVGRRLILWRHGRTRYNAEDRFQGQSDTPLDRVGHEQAAAGARLLVGLRPTSLITSDLSRATQTAAELTRLSGLPAVEDPRLREHDVGQWANLTGDQVAARFPSAYELWRTGSYPHHWEEPLGLARRALDGVKTALANVSERGTLIAVSHGGTIRAVIGSLLGFNAEQWWKLGALGNAHWAVLAETSRGWGLVEYNVGVATLQDPASPQRTRPRVPSSADVSEHVDISAHPDQRRSHV